jgi:4-hydroxythreonine-4-phosphate dehydrogenase
MSLNNFLPILGVTMGDPLGIGPEIICKALPKFKDQARFKIFGDAALLSALSGFEFIPVTQGLELKHLDGKKAGAAAVAYLEAAMNEWDRGGIQGLVTAPISKAHVQAAGFPFPGHTEYLAERTKTKRFAMMMAGPKLRVTLVTIHQPLREIPSSITLDKIVDTIEITYKNLINLFGIARPRLAVCGLNPHGGEAGLLGTEDRMIIAPAIAAAREKGYACEGPAVPDAVFHEAYEGKWDAVVAMYHDQGLIPFKLVHFWEGVNVTLGLPLVRTSPDHGTAFDIAGKDIADSRSMEAAIRMAINFLSLPAAGRP